MVGGGGGGLVGEEGAVLLLEVAGVEGDEEEGEVSVVELDESEPVVTCGGGCGAGCGCTGGGCPWNKSCKFILCSFKLL